MPEELRIALRLARVPPGSWTVPNRSFLSIHADVARPLIRRARRNLKRRTTQMELPFSRERGAEDYLLSDP